MSSTWHQDKNPDEHHLCTYLQETQVDAPCSHEHASQHTSFAWRNFGPVNVSWGFGVIVFGRTRQVPLMSGVEWMVSGK